MKPRYVTRTDDVIAAIKERREALGQSHLEVDERINLAHGHMSKIECFDRKWGKTILRMTPTLGWVLEALGLRLVVMTEADARALEDREHTTREISQVNRWGIKREKEERAVCQIRRRPTVS